MIRLAMSAVAVAWMAFASGAAAQEVSLRELEEAALRHHPELLRIEAHRKRVAAGVRAARAGYFPVVSLGMEGSVSPGNELIEVETGAGRRFLVRGSQPVGEPRAFRAIPRYGTTATVEAMLYDFGRTAGAVDAARATVEAGEMEAVAERERVLEAVRRVYLDWLAADALEALAGESEEAAQAFMERTEERVRAGALPPAERTGARYRWAQARLEVVRARSRTIEARASVDQVVGVALAAGARPDAQDLDVPPRADVDRESPYAEALRLQQRAAHVRARAQGRARAPVVRGVFEGGVFGQLDQVFPSYRAGVQLAVALFDGGLARAAELADRAEAAELGVAMEAEQAAQRVEENAARLLAREAEGRLELAREVEALARDRLGQLEELHALGAATVDQVADARDALRRARAEVLLARVERAAFAWGIRAVR
jgi:outer membrane protein